METNVTTRETFSEHRPWNKGKLIGQNRRFSQSMPGPFGRGSSSAKRRATWLCSTSQSTAGCADAMSSA